MLKSLWNSIRRVHKETNVVLEKFHFRGMTTHSLTLSADDDLEEEDDDDERDDDDDDDEYDGVLQCYRYRRY